MTRRETDPAAPVEAPPDFTRLLRQHQSLREIIESIGSELELRPLLTRILRHACELLGADSGSVGLHDQERNLVRIEAVFNLPTRELGAELAAGVGLAGRVLDTREPVTLERYDQLRIMALPEFHDRAVMGVPIPWGDRLIGTFGVAALAPRRFTADDLEILTLYARHAAIAIQIARHQGHESRRDERLVRLARVGRALAGDADLETLCERAVQAIHESMDYPNVGLGLIDPSDPETIVIRHVGGGFRRQIRGEHRFHVSRGIMGAAVRERTYQLVNDVKQDPRYLPPPGVVGIRSELAAPILCGERVLGVLNLESPGRFSEEDAILLQIIADQLAVAIRHARLLAEARGPAAVGEPEGLAARPEPGAAESPASSALARLRREGLAAMMVAETERVTGERLACDLDLTDYRPQPFEVEEVLYQVFREALHNVVKHARATWVRIRLSCEGGRVMMRIADDGVGFDPDAVPAREPRAPGSPGLRAQRERVEGLGGTLRTHSQPTRGTTVDLLMPCRGARASL